MARFYFLAERAAITVRIKHTHDSWDSRFDWQTPRIARSRHHSHGRTMIRAISRNDFFSPRYQLGHFQSVFVGFRSTQREKRLRQARNFGKFFSECAARLCRETRSCKAQLVHLLLDGLEHFRMLVPQV